VLASTSKRCCNLKRSEFASIQCRFVDAQTQTTLVLVQRCTQGIFNSFPLPSTMSSHHRSRRQDQIRSSMPLSKHRTTPTFLLHIIRPHTITSSHNLGSLLDSRLTFSLFLVRPRDIVTFVFFVFFTKLASELLGIGSGWSVEDEG